MALLQNVIPIRWTGGPIEIARRGKSEGFTPQIRQTLERFHDPASLDILKGSPFDCLVVNWAAGLAEDAAQQKSAAPLLEAARKLNLAVVGWVDAPADPGAAIASAKSAGLAAVAVRDFKGPSDLPVIPFGDHANTPWDAAGPVLAVTDNVWPGVSMPGGGGAAGPTSVPWLDSNGWFLQMARARTEAAVWLMFDPPAKGRVIPAQNYPTAVCDCEVAGGRWVVSFDDALRAGLADGNASARETLKQVGATAAYFEKHAAWKSYRSLGVVGVISDFTGENLDLSGEILNLMSRRSLLFRVVWKSKAMAQPFTGLKALVYADKAAPSAELRRKMMTFAEQGGLLITGPKWGPEGKPAPLDFNTQFEVRSLGKGRLAVARQELADAYQVAVDAQFLVSYGNDLVKLYNSSSSGCTRFTGSPDGKKALLQVLSYAGGGGRYSGQRTVWIRDRYRATRLLTVDGEPVPLQPAPSEEFFGMEYQLAPTVPGYFAMEFEA